MKVSSTNIITIYLAIFSLWTVLCQAAMLLGISYNTLVNVFIVTLAIGVISVYRYFPQFHIRFNMTEYRKINWQIVVLLFITALSVSMISLFSIRPDADDVSYISRTLWFLDNPRKPMDLAYHHHALLDREMVYPLMLPYTVEHFWGLISFLSGISYLDIYHRVVPLVLGGLLPIVWFIALSRFIDRNEYVIYGVIFICTWLLIDGQSHHSIGNFAFVRIWQGKALLMSLFPPLIIAFSMDWFRDQSLGNYLKLIFLCISGCGLTASSLFFFPAYFLLLFSAFFIATTDYRRIFFIGFGYFSTLIYIILNGVYIKSVSGKNDYHFLGFEFGFPSDFSGQWSMVFGKGLNYSPIILITCTLLALFLTNKYNRYFIIGWLTAAFLLIFNPIVMPYVSKLLTSDNGYWRLFYTLPFILCLGLVGSHIAEKITLGVRGAFIAYVFAVSAIFAMNIISPTIGVLGEIRFDISSRKVFSEKEVAVKRIIGKGIPGPMLAPLEFSVWIPMYTTLYPQLSVRHIFLPHFGRLWNQTDMSNSRLRAERYVSGEAPESYINFIEQLNAPVKNIILSKKMIGMSQATNALQSYGFQLVDKTSNYSLYTRE